MADVTPSETPPPPHRYLIFFCFPGEIRDVVERVAKGLQSQLLKPLKDQFPDTLFFFDRYSIPVGFKFEHACRAANQRSLLFVPFITHHFVREDFNKVDPRAEVIRWTSKPNWKEAFIPVYYTSRSRLRAEETDWAALLAGETDPRIVDLGKRANYPNAVVHNANNSVDDLVAKLLNAILSSQSNLGTLQVEMTNLTAWPSVTKGGCRLAPHERFNIDTSRLPANVEALTTDLLASFPRVPNPAFTLIFVYLTLQDLYNVQHVDRMISAANGDRLVLCALFERVPNLNPKSNPNSNPKSNPSSNPNLNPNSNPNLRAPRLHNVAGLRGFVRHQDENLQDFGKRVAVELRRIYLSDTTKFLPSSSLSSLVRSPQATQFPTSLPNSSSASVLPSPSNLSSASSTLQTSGSYYRPSHYDVWKASYYDEVAKDRYFAGMGWSGGD